MTKKDPKIQKEIAREVIFISPDVDQIVCDGGGGPLGHPQVWYTFDGRKEADCFYCGRHFVKQAQSAPT